MLLFESRKYDEIDRKVADAGKNASDELKKEQQKAKAKLSRALIKLAKYNGIDETEYEKVKALYESIDSKRTKEKKEAEERLKEEENRKRELEYTYNSIMHSTTLFSLYRENGTRLSERPDKDETNHSKSPKKSSK